MKKYTSQQNNSANQSIDWQTVSVDTVLNELKVDPTKGLSFTEAEKRLHQYGANALEEKEVSIWQKILRHFMGPIAYMIEAAAIISALIGHWDDFAIIMALLLFNVTIEVWQDRKASTALSALKKSLAPEANVLRDGKWQTIPASTLVPGDIVKIRLGMIVPADLRMLKGNYVSIDQAALTGESLPVTKQEGDLAYSGSVVKQGEMETVVIATGSNTFFGRTAKLVANAGSVSHAQKAMFQIGNFLIIIAIILAMVMVAFRVYNDITVTHSWNIDDALGILQFVLVLLVASIPVAMPTVFSVTLALGALALSKEKAIVSRLSAITEMAGVDILCSDKTGTLTKNQLTLGEPILFDCHNPQECILFAALASKSEDKDAIDTAVIQALENKKELDNWQLESFIPFDPVLKRTEACQLNKVTGKKYLITKGAPQVVIDLAKLDIDKKTKVEQSVTILANKGFRALAVAVSDDDGQNWTILGVLSMFDPPRDDSALTIKTANQHGIKVKMITGDDTAIAIETARQLGMGTNIINASDVFPAGMDPDNVSKNITDIIEKSDGFARVFPEHKYAIVKALQKRGHIVAMTGDGVNDAPALKQADCGTAVDGSTDAARGAAALILTAPGLSVINMAINEARRIFERITSYTIYRVALTMAIMFLVVLSSILFGFQPLTPIMIVVMSLLDDIPIMAIAYDHTALSPKPIRWKMSRLLSISTVLGLFTIVQSFILLYLGVDGIQHTGWSWFQLAGFDQLQTVMFLQLVVCGHLLLFVTRTPNWFFHRPYPAPVLFWAIMITQVVAAIMCLKGWLVTPIDGYLIMFIWGYNLIWTFILGFVRIILENISKFKA